MIALIIVGVILVLGLIVFLLRKYVPAFKSEDKGKQTPEEVSKSNVDKMVVTMDEHNPEEIAKKEKERKDAIKKIKKESLTEEEENRRLAELEKEDYKDETFNGQD